MFDKSRVIVIYLILNEIIKNLAVNQRIFVHREFLLIFKCILKYYIFKKRKINLKIEVRAIGTSQTMAILLWLNSKIHSIMQT